MISIKEAAMDFTLLLGAIVVLTTVMFAQSRIESRLRSQEAKIDKLLSHLGIELDGPLEEPSETVKQLARTPGQYIAAITAYRQQTGAGLKEAKAVIDKLVQAASSPAVG
jgi:ribosomal protein L7/L12